MNLRRSMQSFREEQEDSSVDAVAAQVALHKSLVIQSHLISSTSGCCFWVPVGDSFCFESSEMPCACHFWFVPQSEWKNHSTIAGLRSCFRTWWFCFDNSSHFFDCLTCPLCICVSLPNFQATSIKESFGQVWKVGYDSETNTGFAYSLRTRKCRPLHAI